MLKRLGDASLLWPSLLCTALVFTACHHPNPDPDGGTEDMIVVPDLASPPDLACNPADPGCTPPVDMRMPPGDMKPPTDMPNPPTDMATDMTTPPVDMSTDMTTPPTDMATDMTMPPGDMATDMTMPPGDMATDMTMPPSDMPPPPIDMTMPPVDMRTPDMFMPPIDMAADGGSGTGGIGAPCTADTECKSGPTPTCWKANVLNNPANPATAGGYCSSQCSVEADCGGGAHCINIGAGKYCLKGCADATTCRHPGYACSFIGGGVCYPDSIYDCDPKGTSCTESGTGKAGGCLREAFEDKGSCSAGCSVGTGTCADRPTGVKRQCIYFDMSRNGYMDGYKGLICVQSVASPKMVGDPCTFLNECVDGAECSGVDGKCHNMCVKGGTPACTAGMCQDDLMTPAGGPGLCR